MSQHTTSSASAESGRSFAVDVDTRNMIEQANLANWKSLIRLRWAAVAGQLLTAFLSVAVLGFVMPWTEFSIIITAEVLANIVALRVVRMGHTPSGGMLAGAMVFDLLAFTGLLFLTGGVENPFNFLFVIHIALAAVFLHQRWLWTLVFAAIIGFALLFLAPPAYFSPNPSAPLAPATGIVGIRYMDWELHLWGTWTAFGIAAVCIATFVGAQVKELRERERQVRIAEEMSQRSARLASLAALAAGAAHELSTPLSTIALVAGDLGDFPEEELDEERKEEISEDAALIRAEVERCRLILDRLSADAGAARAGGLGRTRVTDFKDDVLERIRDASRVRVDMGGLRSEWIQYPIRPLVHAVAAVIQNGLRASEDGEVVLEFRSNEDELQIEVRDKGVGMPPDILERATDPFFTTRPEGHGMGLGLFLARNVTETLGGDFTIQSAPQEGTTVLFRLPLETPLNHTHEDVT
jgi:two-component system sensor histidine kinase RegB